MQLEVAVVMEQTTLDQMVHLVKEIKVVTVLVYMDKLNVLAVAVVVKLEMEQTLLQIPLVVLVVLV
jgi:hypothetical protein